jgi:TonB family protein
MRRLGLALACVVGLTPVCAAAAPSVPADQPRASTVAPLTVHPLPDAKTPPTAIVNVPTDASGGGLWASIWPHDAYAERISGRVILTCNVDRYGLAESCEVAAETPPNKGFGKAALEMRPLIKLPPPGGRNRPAETVENIAIDFNAPEATVDFAGPPPGRHKLTSDDIDMSSGNFSTIANRLPEKRAITMLDNPVWESAPSFADVAAAYPAKGAGPKAMRSTIASSTARAAFPAARRRRRRPRTAASTGPPSRLQRSSAWRRSRPSRRITPSSGSIFRSASQRRVRPRIVS